MANRIQIRRDTAANWDTINPILADGELGLESDTGKIKSGNGSSAWTSLDYIAGDQLVNETATLTLGNDGVLYPQGSVPNQGLKITPTGSVEDYHVHLTSGDHDTIAIILGDDNSYVGSVSGAVGIGVTSATPSTEMYDYGFWGATWGDVGLDRNTETGTSVVYDNNGNLYVVGSIDNRNTGNPENLILKYNPTGQLVWQRGWANNNGPVCALNESIAFAYNKLYYVANDPNGDSTYVGTNNLDGSLDSPIFYVNANLGIDIIADNATLSSSKVFVGGESTDSNISTLMKVDLTTSAIDSMISINFGTDSRIECITQDNSGYVYAIHGGYSGNSICYLTKHDPADLAIIWQKELNSNDFSYGISVGFNQGFVYALTIETSGSNTGGSLRKITQSGNLIWTYLFNNGSSTTNLPSDISFDVSGNIYITTVNPIDGKLIITKLSKTGTVVWSKLISNDTGEVVTGNIIRGSGHRSGDIFNDRIAITGGVSRPEEFDLITVQLPIDGSITTETQEWNIENFTWNTNTLVTTQFIDNVASTVTPLTPSTGTFTGSITVTDSTLEYSTNTVTFESRPVPKYWQFMSDGNIILPPGDHDIKEYDYDGGLYSALDNRESYTVRQFVSSPIFFSKVDYQDPNPGDNIGTGLTLKRANNQGLFNSLSEASYTSSSPAGTEWNWDGWDDLSNVNIRKYTSLKDALNGYIGNHIVGAELVMHDMINKNYWTFKFLSWTQGGGGGGYSYVRRQINSRDLVKTRGITYNNETVQTTAYTPIVKQHFWDDQAADGETYELGLRDCGKHIYATGTYGDTIRVPNWSTVEFPVGTMIYIATQSNNIAITYDTEVTIWASGTNLSNQAWLITPRSLGTLLCVEQNVWILSSTGLDY